MVKDDRGAANLIVIPVAMGLVFATLLLINMLGSATDNARHARTAADAAALAAASAWSDQVKADFDDALRDGDPHDFWDFLLGGYHRPSEPCARARAFALQNGADPRPGGVVCTSAIRPDGVTVTVRVRDAEIVPGTDRRMERQATARVVFTSGVCLGTTRIGYLERGPGGGCVTTRPPYPSGAYFEMLDVGPYRAEITLVG